MSDVPSSNMVQGPAIIQLIEASKSRLGKYVDVNRPIVNTGFEVVKAGSGVAVGEISGMVASVGVIWHADRMFVNERKKLVEFVSQYIISPHQPIIERLMDYALVRTPEEKAERHALSAKIRAEGMAESMVTNTFAGLVHLPVSLIAQEQFDTRLVGSHRHGGDHVKARIYDGMAHLGALVLMHTVARHQTRAVSDAFEKVLTKVGMSEKRAHETSTFFVRLMVPGWIGLGMRVKALMNSEQKNTPHI